jgi:hypothetical protein
MKIDRRALYCGLLLIAVIPLLLLYQSSNTSKGTSRGWSKYNVYIEVSMINSHLYCGNTEALHPLCRFTLGFYGNGTYTAAWIDHIASLYGECADVHLARAWLASFMRDAVAMRREFAAARAAARDEAELERVNELINQVMR